MSAYDFHLRGFANAVWSKNRIAATLLKGGGEVAKNPFVAEAFADCIKLYHKLCFTIN